MSRFSSGWQVAVAFALLSACARVARAGMPSVTLTDVGQLRLETISFFLGVFLLSAAVVRWAWNSLRREIPKLPPLSYGRACGLTLLWGLLFIVVLTMISGARELMTPGAWEKKGATYKLRTDPEQPDGTVGQEKATLRRARLARLADELLHYAERHEGRFPSQAGDAEIPDRSWQLDDSSVLPFVYVPGQIKNDHRIPLAYEPQLVDGDSWILFTDGHIERLPFGDILALLPVPQESQE